MREDKYTTENNFTIELPLFDKVLHNQVIYRDGRLYQSFILEWKNYRICDVRDFIKNLKNHSGIMEMLSNVQPFASYGFVSNKLAITFKKDLVFPKERALATIKYIINMGTLGKNCV